MRRPQPQPRAAGAAIGAEQPTEPVEIGAEAKAGAAEIGAAEQPQPAGAPKPPPTGAPKLSPAGAPKPPSMITPPEEGTELITGAPIEGAPNDGPIAGPIDDGAPMIEPESNDGALIAGPPITDSPIDGPIAVGAELPQLLTNTGT